MVAAATLALILLAVLTMRSSPHLILVVELVVIAGFAYFWWMQTRELWDYPTREEKTQKVDEVLEKDRREREQVRPRPGSTEPEPPSGPVPAPEPSAPGGPADETPKSRGDVYEALRGDQLVVHVRVASAMGSANHKRAVEPLDDGSRGH